MIGRFPLLKVHIKMISGGLHIKFWFKSVDLETKWVADPAQCRQSVDRTNFEAYARNREQEAQEKE